MHRRIPRSSLISSAAGLLLSGSLFAGTPTTGLLYYTRYQSPSQVKKVRFTYDGGRQFALSNATAIATLPGADGLTVGPTGELIVGSCGGNSISEVDPVTGAFTTVPSGGGACHVVLDPSRTKAWAGITYNGNSALSEIPLLPEFTNGIPHPITGSETGVGTLAWDGTGTAYYTVSGPSGGGNFGLINLQTFVTTRLLANLPAAHGMAYDAFSGTFLLFGSTHITQVLATPTNATVVGDLVFPVQEFDQGTVDSRGHIFVADNGGTMGFVDYSASGQLTNTSTFATNIFLESYLDDVAPVGLVGAGGVADVAVSVTAAPDPARIGAPLTLTLTVTNLGPATATEVVLNDTLPGNAVFLSAVATLGSWGVTNGVLTCVAPSLAASNSFTLTITLQPQSGALPNHVVVLAQETDPYFPNNLVDTTIAAPYACLAAPAGLISWWPGDGSTADVVGTNNGSLAVTNRFAYAPGLVGQAFAPDGVAEYVTVPDSPSLRPTNLTVECWASFNRADACRVLLGKPVGSGSDDSYVLWVQDGVLHATTLFAGGGGPVLAYTLNPVPGLWYHLAYTVANTSSNQVLYVNGEPVAAAVAGGTLAYDNHPFLIGADINNGGFSCLFSGLIDEPALYNRALTAEEISALYYAGPEGKCLTPTIVPATLVPGTTNQPYAQPLSLAHAFPPFTFTQGDAQLPPGMSLAPNGLFAGTPTTVGTFPLDVRATDGSNHTAQASLPFAVVACQPAPAGLLAWWRGETNAADELGQHNGTLHGGVTFTNGYIGSAFSFDGQSGYVDLGTWSPGSRWTVEAWVSSATFQSGRRGLVSAYQSCMDWGIALQDGQFMATIRQPGGCSYGVPSGVFAQTGLWYHVAETVDGTNAIVYVNGVAYGTNAVEPNYVGTTAGLRLGSSVCCGEYFAGLIDEAAVYDRALSAAEIASLYNASVAGKCPVGPPPTLTLSPTNTTATAFGAANLCAAASGPGTLGYQWYLNSVPITGATNACLSLSNLVAGDAGTYSVAVQNASGAVLSPAATLTVIGIGAYAGVTINGTVGAQYRIDYSTPTNPAVWTTLTTLSLPSSPYVYIDLASSAINARNYRVVKQP